MQPTVRENNTQCWSQVQSSTMMPMMTSVCRDGWMYLTWVETFFPLTCSATLWVPDPINVATCLEYIDRSRYLPLTVLVQYLHLMGWWRGTVVVRRSLAGELSLSCARPAADG